MFFHIFNHFCLFFVTNIGKIYEGKLKKYNKPEISCKERQNPVHFFTQKDIIMQNSTENVGFRKTGHGVLIYYIRRKHDIHYTRNMLPQN